MPVWLYNFTTTLDTTSNSCLNRMLRNRRHYTTTLDSMTLNKSSTKNLSTNWLRNRLVRFSSLLSWHTWSTLSNKNGTRDYWFSVNYWIRFGNVGYLLDNLLKTTLSADTTLGASGTQLSVSCK